MPFKNRLLLAMLLSVLALLFAIWFTPPAVSNGLRLWIWWRARQQGLTVKIDKIEAPFLRPVVLHGFHMISARDATLHIEVSAARATVGLNLKAIIMHMSGRAIRNLSSEGLRLEIHRSKPAGMSLTESGWATLQKLLPGNLDFGHFDLRVEDGPAVILLRSVSLSASEIDAGRFRADEVTIASPWFRQTFSHLRGATKWEDNRLTLAGLSLTHGLDLPSVTTDLSHLDKENVGVTFDVEVFGGKIRASISNEWRSHVSNWNLMGSAADISLAQTAEAIGFTDRVGGSLHACNFTFRGDPRDLTHATASLWTELTGLSWRHRAAEVIMLGAALYNRQVELEQLYIKQKKNQLTLSGEASFPTNSSDWLKPDFRGDISASISNLGDLAGLFGANPGDFAGEIAIEGIMNARDRKIGGHLTASGTSLSIFKTQIDNFNAKLNLKASELEVEQLDLRRKQDSLHVEGKIDIGSAHNYSGSLSADISDLSDYLSIFGGAGVTDSNPAPAHVDFTVESSVWSGSARVAIPNSEPISFTAASLPLRIGETWNEFSMTPLQIALGFRLVSLANAPHWLGLGIFRGGILSGGIQVSGTPRRPNIEGDVQLIDGKMENEGLSLSEASGRVHLSGSHGVIDFLQARNKDVDLSFNGEVDVSNPDAVAITLAGILPIFQMTSHPAECVSRIEVLPVGTLLAPVIDRVEFRGGFVNRNWTITLEPTGRELIESTNIATQPFPLCLGTPFNGQVLMLGTPARSASPAAQARKRAKRR